MISRRLLLQHSTTATALAGLTMLPAGAPAAETPDPCLAFIDAWDQAVDRFEAQADSPGAETYWKTHCDPYDRAAFEGRIPKATTAAGAAAVLCKLLEFTSEESQPQDFHLIRVALAFLERESRT